MFVTWRGRRGSGGDTHEPLHSGWLKERVQEFPVAPNVAPPGPLRLPADSANFLLLPLHRFEPALPLATSPLWLPELWFRLAELELLQPLTDGPSPELPPVLLLAR